jgi:hypothetical protein
MEPKAKGQMLTPTSNYLADAYETFSSSAQAAQGLTRNVVAGIFPLFGQQMVRKQKNHAKEQVFKKQENQS